MAPINYQQQHHRHLEDGLAAHEDEKAILRADASQQTSPRSSQSPPRSRKMNLRRFSITFGVGLLVGFGLVSASRSRPHRSLCSEEIHAANDHEMKALVEKTKDDTTAVSEILRCASPETFHRLVSVYFPERSKSDAGSRAEAIGHDETWLLTAWDKLVKRQDEGAGNPSTPSDSATDSAAEGSGSATSTAGDPPSASDPADDNNNEDDGSSDPPTNGNDPSETLTNDVEPTDPPVDDGPSTEADPEPTSSNPPPSNGDGDNGDDGEDTSPSVDVPPPASSSTGGGQPEPTNEEPTSDDPPPAPTTSSSSSSSSSSTSEEEVPVESTTEAPEPSSTSEQPDSESSTSEDEPPVISSTSSTSESSSSTVPEETTSIDDEDEDDDEPQGPSRTTIHRSSSAAAVETITSVNDEGRTVLSTSTMWVSVDPPAATEEGESDPSLQDAGLSLRANVGPAVIIGGLVTVLLMS